MEINYLQFGLNISDRRRALHMTQEELAEKINKTPKHISAIEKGRCKPKLDTFIKICTALDVTPDYFILGIIRDKNFKNINDMLQLCSPDDCIIIEDIIKSFIYRRPRS